MGGKNVKYAYVNIDSDSPYFKRSYRFKYDELIKYKSKYLIYRNIQLEEDINFLGRCVPSVFSYKYIIHIPSIHKYLFIDDTDICMYIISGVSGLYHFVDVEICGPKLSTDIFDEALVYLKIWKKITYFHFEGSI